MRILPELFENSIKSHFSDLAEGVLSAIKTQDPIPAILLNPVKPNSIKYHETIPWNKYGRTLSHRPDFITDPLYHAGTYYSQEPSSMIVGHLAKLFIGPNNTVLDLCASPGGKTLNLLNHSFNATIVANEINPVRNSILRENLAKWGASNIIVTQDEASAFRKMPGFFDFVLIDAPCSGEGMFRKDPFAIEQWSSELQEQCFLTQKEIVANGMSCLRKGGTLVYSTCTLNMRENESVGNFILKNGFEELQIPIPENWGTKKANVGHYFLPGRSLGEGLYFACFVKTTEGDVSEIEKRKTPTVISAIQINEEEISNETIVLGTSQSVVDERTTKVFNVLKEAFHIKKVGIEFSKTIKGIAKPSIEWSLSAANLNANGIDLSNEEALNYLKGNPIKSSQKGWRTVKYKNIPIGLVKGTGSRLNNHHPKNWRIRKHI